MRAGREERSRCRNTVRVCDLVYHVVPVLLPGANRKYIAIEIDRGRWRACGERPTGERVGRDGVMLKALQGMFAGAEGPAPDDDERDASGRPKVTLAKALKRGWLEVWYQPKVSLQTGNMIGAEGLIRLRHPELGVLGPGAFLPGAGEAEMLEMTEQVIITALRDWGDCAALGMPAINLAVNVPASAFVELPI